MKNNRQGLTEFDIISRYFSDIGCSDIECSDIEYSGIGSPDANATTHRTDTRSLSTVALGVGDDCALLSIPAKRQLALSIDTLIAGRHFPEDADAFDIARRAVAVSVSDLAAMGATPLAFTLALALPDVEPDWLARFSDGLRQAAALYRMPLVGGDTTRGPLTITIQVHGTVPLTGGLRRSGAKVGDSVFVTGNVGDGAAALAMLQQRLTVTAEQRQFLHERFYAPQARVALAEQLLTVANAAIDISDGLLADLGHICRASGLAATLYSEKLPLSNVLQSAVAREQAVRYALSGGDDYELCFTAAPEQRVVLEQYAGLFDLPITEIGQLAVGEGVVCLDQHANPLTVDASGYQHF